MMRQLGIAALLVSALTACRAPAPAPAEPVVDPQVNAAYRGDLDVDQFVGRFETESREIYRERERIVADLGLSTGESVADIGAGTGLFTLLFACAVGAEGRVFAVDIAPDFLERIRERAAESGLQNVTTILGTDESSELPANSVDLVFICDTYHHFEQPRHMLESIHRALREGGALVIVDFERIPGYSRSFILDHVRAGRDVFIDEICSAGFELAEIHPRTAELTENYVLRFRKAGASK